MPKAARVESKRPSGRPRLPRQPRSSCLISPNTCASPWPITGTQPSIRQLPRSLAQTRVCDVLGLIFRLLIGLVVALSVGFGTSYYALTDGRLFAAVRVGAWAAWPDVGQPMPDPYSRAYLARTGTLQLGYAEGLQFTASTDDAG